jgi:ADP-heptose:LPS heptosyltransferase
VPERIGVSDGGANFFNTHHAPFWSNKGPFVMRYYAALAKRWPGLPPLPFADYLPSVQVDKPKNNYICLMPGSIWPSKAWPVEYYRKIAGWAAQSDTDVVLLGAASEKGMGDVILAESPGHNLCGQTDLQQAAAWLHGARAAIGNDSGLSHLAAVCSTHTFAIFGPTDPDGSAPWGLNAVALKPENLLCSPCFKRQCPLPERKCLLDISPTLVWEHIRPLIH